MWLFLRNIVLGFVRLCGGLCTLLVTLLAILLGTFGRSGSSRSCPCRYVELNLLTLAHIAGNRDGHLDHLLSFLGVRMIYLLKLLSLGRLLFLFFGVAQKSSVIFLFFNLVLSFINFIVIDRQM